MVRCARWALRCAVSPARGAGAGSALGASPHEDVEGSADHAAVAAAPPLPPADSIPLPAVRTPKELPKPPPLIKRRRKNPAAPKNPRSAYLFYVAEQRSAMSKDPKMTKVRQRAAPLGHTGRLMMRAAQYTFTELAR
jgi:hypothetical protein